VIGVPDEIAARGEIAAQHETVARGGIAAVMWHDRQAYLQPACWLRTRVPLCRGYGCFGSPLRGAVERGDSQPAVAAKRLRWQGGRDCC